MRFPISHSLLLTLLFPILLHGQDSITSIRVMTYNIWYDNPGNQGNSWNDRRDGVQQTLRGNSPDVLCVQEALSHQVKDVQLVGYDHVGKGRDDGRMAGEFTAIFFRTKRFELLENGMFWLSPRPDSAGSVGWDAHLPRTVTWAHLLDRENDSTWWIFNTHLSHVGDTARMQSVGLILEFIAGKCGEEAVVLAGDFNFKKDSAPYDHLSGGWGGVVLADARYINGIEAEGPDYTYTGADFLGEQGDIIDHVFISRNVHVDRSMILDNCRNGRCPSDHLPVVVELSRKP